ncbi:Vascular endothelial growth factor receptor 1 [Anopheles sinensis]|uniref:Vascular endothelial growth factor receptor 1 n=1 Tax=Anopheles sinensis TaxID=74873 RepID=A0A084VXY1_ANOSI|nr:Vascular endothelial growth factor receptor 1 [Anopheles sinensis]
MMQYSGDESIRKSMISELKMYVLIGQHLNIVNFLGMVTENLRAGTHELVIVLEYCRYGNLLEFIRKHKPKFMDCKNDIPEAWTGYSLDADLSERPNEGCITRFQTVDLICWASQIANGMKYLASKNVCHGDLAARNILLCDKNVVKISDFGLARVFNRGNFYKKTSNDRVPYKWMALESIFELVFSVKTDVWSYGVLLWELFSLGATPYPTYTVDEEFLNKLRDGYRMDRPEYASKEIYEVMRTCWYVNPDLRPSFESLAQTFNVMLPHVLQNHYLKLNDKYLEANARRALTMS